MKFLKFSGFLFILSLLAVITACEEETTTIGSSIATGEVVITVDTFNFNLDARAIPIEMFDSKTGNLMIGSIQTPDYGKLNCSFVTRLMCVPYLNVPDSLLNPERVDSCKLIMGANRDQIIGDSLAPQKLTIYKLTKQLPADITNMFDPQGYYDPQDPFATKSYTVSGIAQKDSAFYNNNFVEITVDLPISFGQEIFQSYIDNPTIFQWPQTMAQNFLPGLYVESSFGKGCIANIESAYLAVFYYSLFSSTTEDEDGKSVTTVSHVTNVTFPFTVSPEVLSSNNIEYLPSEFIKEKNEINDGEVIITTPGGYISSFEFPAQTLIDRYNEKNVHLSTVNDLILYIPAEEVDSESDLGLAENLLLIKSSEYESFFEENKTPDNLSSFTGVYDAKNKRYYFTSMRSYFLDLVSKKELTPEDVTFTIVPVEIETETQNSYYGNSTTYVTKCVPFISKPTLTLLKTGESMVTFSFSTQLID